jgi:hypothetical protein
MFAAGSEHTPEDRRALNLEATRAIADVARIANVTLMTPHVAAQNWANSLYVPDASLQDEAGKMSDAASLAGLAWSRANDGQRVIDNMPVCQVLCGDLNQPNPHKDPKATHPFHEQGSVSLFRRIVVGGGTVLTLNKQYRYTHSIADLVNYILPDGHVETSSTVAALPVAMTAANYFKTQWQTEESVVYLGVPSSKAEQLEVSGSSYNLAHIPRAFWVIITLLGSSIEPKKIGIQVPYSAQKDFYIKALYEFEEYCRDCPAGTGLHRVAAQVHEIQIFTVDGIQGDECEFIIYDTVITDQLGFLADTQRMLLSITRPRVCLIIIGNPTGVSRHANDNKHVRYTATAFFKVYSWAQKKGLYYDLRKLDRDGVRRVAPLKFTFTDKRVYQHRPSDNNPFTYGVTPQPALKAIDWLDMIGSPHPAELGVDVGQTSAELSVDVGATQAGGEDSNAGSDNGWGGENAPAYGGGW